MTTIIPQPHTPVKVWFVLSDGFNLLGTDHPPTPVNPTMSLGLWLGHIGEGGALGLELANGQKVIVRPLSEERKQVRHAKRIGHAH